MNEAPDAGSPTPTATVIRFGEGDDPASLQAVLSGGGPVEIDLCGRTVVMQPCESTPDADLFVLHEGITLRNGKLKLSRLVVRPPPRKGRGGGVSRRGSFIMGSPMCSRPDSPTGSKLPSPATSPQGSRAASFTQMSRRRSSALQLSTGGGPGITIEDVTIEGRVHIEGGRVTMKNCQVPVGLLLWHWHAFESDKPCSV